MTEDGDAHASSLDAIRALERRLAERSLGTSAVDAALAAAEEEAERIRARARVQGEEAAQARRREVLEETEREAARIRAEGDRRSVELQLRMAAMLPRTVAALSSIVLPAAKESQCSSR